MDLTHMARLKPATQGVTSLNIGYFPREGLDDTTNIMTGGEMARAQYRSG